MTSRRLRLLQVGFGGVGRAFAALLLERHDEVEHRYGLDLQLVGVASSRSTWLASGPIPPAARRQIVTDLALSSLPGDHRDWNGERAIHETTADLMIEATSGGLQDGEPASTHARVALEHGMHVVAASKGAWVWNYSELHDLARAANLQIRFGAATGAALPTLDVATYGLAGSRVRRIDGVLNGTSNYVLTQMAREGATFAAALLQAQSWGVAEADPHLDVEGFDTAAKLVLMSNAVWGTGMRLSDVAVRGITGLQPADLTRAADHGGTLRLLGSLENKNGSCRATVAPTVLPPEHPLAHVEGLEKGVTFWTDTMDRITVMGGRSDPNGAAAALLRDVINLASATGSP